MEKTSGEDRGQMLFKNTMCCAVMCGIVCVTCLSSHDAGRSLNATDRLALHAADRCCTTLMELDVLGSISSNPSSTSSL